MEMGWLTGLAELLQGDSASPQTLAVPKATSSVLVSDFRFFLKTMIVVGPHSPAGSPDGKKNVFSFGGAHIGAISG